MLWLLFFALVNRQGNLSPHGNNECLYLSALLVGGAARPYRFLEAFVCRGKGLLPLL
jgi:hypothetical protein